MRKLFFIGSIIGLMLSCTGGTTESSETGELTEQDIMAIEDAMEELEEAMDSTEMVIDSLESAVDSLLNEI